MTINWYSLKLSIGTDIADPTYKPIIVNYYFSVDSTTSLITSFYNYNNIGVNIIAPMVLPPPFILFGDNLFDESTLLFTTNNGVNFSDNALASYLSIEHLFPSGTLLYFNFYDALNITYFYLYISNPSLPNGTNSTEWETYTSPILITRIPYPPYPPQPQKCVINLNLCRAYTNNAQVFYKPHSLAAGGIGGTRNHRAKSKRT